MRSILFFTLFMTCFSNARAADWTGFKGCGLYEARGVVKFVNKIPTMILNQGSKSEIRISVEIKEEYKLAPYIDRPFIAELKINRTMNGSLGQAQIEKIDSRLPNPVNPRDTGLSFLKKGECVK